MSLSSTRLRLIKALDYQTSDDRRVITIESERVLHPTSRTVVAEEGLPSGQEKGAHSSLQESQVREQANQLIHEANEQVQQMMMEANERIAEQRELAQKEIDDWWTSRRAADDQVVAKKEEQGYEQGYASGVQSAEEELRKQWEEKIGLAERVLAEAYEQKEEIIATAEPQIIELSVALAKKVIRAQIDLAPEKLLSMVQQLIQQRKMDGHVSLHVSPERFDYVQQSEVELLQLIDPQIELRIFPDRRVRDDGCIIYSSFGSMDARVETQLENLQATLLEIANGKSEQAKRERDQDG